MEYNMGRWFGVGWGGDGMIMTGGGMVMGWAQCNDVRSGWEG